MDTLHPSSTVLKKSDRFAHWDNSIHIDVTIGGETATPFAGEKTPCSTIFKDNWNRRTPETEMDEDCLTTTTFLTATKGSPITSEDNPAKRAKDEAPSMKWSKINLLSKAREMGLYTDSTMTKRGILEAIWIKARS